MIRGTQGLLEPGLVIPVAAVTGTWQDDATIEEKPLTAGAFSCWCLDRRAGHLARKRDNAVDRGAARMTKPLKRGTISRR